ncbi:hypothetical protein V8C40DRAFT_237151 [Trichoderma camerunense]
MSAKKRKSLLPVSTGRARARIRRYGMGSSDSRWTPLVADGCHNGLIMLMPTAGSCMYLSHHIVPSHPIPYIAHPRAN